MTGSGEEGVQTYNHGTKPAARYWARGTFQALDQYGQPAAGVTVRVSFKPENAGEQDFQNVVTDANGYGTYNLDGIRAGYYIYTYRYRSATGRWEVYYDNAVVKFEPKDANGNNIPSNSATTPYYYWWGIQYMGT